MAKKKEEEEKKPEYKQPEVFRDVSGRMTGVTTPGGSTLLGMKPNEVRAYLDRQSGVTGLEQTAAPVGTQKELESIEKVKLEQAEVGLPRTRGLVPDKFDLGVEGLPARSGINVLLKSSLGEAMAGKSALKKRDMAQVVDLTNQMNELGLTPKQASDDPVTQTLLKMQFNEIDKQVLDDGKAKVSTFNQVVEALPLGKYAGYVIKKTPSGQIKTMEKEVLDIQGDSMQWLRSAMRSPHLRDNFADLIAEAEDRTLYLESNIKLLVMQSPYLQANPEEVELLMSKIDGVKTTLRERKIAVSDPLLLAQYMEFEGMLG